MTDTERLDWLTRHPDELGIRVDYRWYTSVEGGLYGQPCDEKKYTDVRRLIDEAMEQEDDQ